MGLLHFNLGNTGCSPFPGALHPWGTLAVPRSLLHFTPGEHWLFPVPCCTSPLGNTGCSPFPAALHPWGTLAVPRSLLHFTPGEH
ncbi:hypothetical protein ACOMHN_060563 [Nucella lapillus]